jgi:hypothetical protein
MDEKEVIRYDYSRFKPSSKRTDEGFIMVDTVVTRSGIFTYMNADGTMRREFRPETEVFDQASMDSLKLKPVTNLHPAERLVDPETARKLAIGSVGDNVRRDGDNLVASFAVTHKDGIEAITKGREEISLGYRVILVREDGVHKGEPYEFRQTRIRYNHLALVDSARAGKEARVPRLDAQDCVQVEEEDLTNQNRRNNDMSDKDKQVSVRLDNIDYKCDPEIANALAKEKTRADGLQEKLTKAEGDITAEKNKATQAQAKLDEAEGKLKAATNNDEAVRKGVTERVALMGQTSEVLGKEYKFDAKSNTEIKSDFIMKIHGDDKDGVLKKKLEDPVYLQARFDSAIESRDSSTKKTAAAKTRENLHQRSDGDGKARTSEQARQDMIDHQSNAYKGEQETK